MRPSLEYSTSPVAGFKPKTNRSTEAIMDIKTKGTKTIIQDIIPRPLLHMTLSIIVNTMATHTFTKAILYIPLYVSITICMNEYARYNSAGAHNLSSSIYYTTAKKNMLLS